MVNLTKLVFLKPCKNTRNNWYSAFEKDSAAREKGKLHLVIVSCSGKSRMVTTLFPAMTVPCSLGELQLNTLQLLPLCCWSRAKRRLTSCLAHVPAGEATSCWFGKTDAGTVSQLSSASPVKAPVCPPPFCPPSLNAEALNYCRDGKSSA